MKVRVLKAMFASIVLLSRRLLAFWRLEAFSPRGVLRGCRAALILFRSSAVMIWRHFLFFAIFPSALFVFLAALFSLVSGLCNLPEPGSSSNEYTVLTSAHSSPSSSFASMSSEPTLNMLIRSLFLVFLFLLDNGLESTITSSISRIFWMTVAIAR